MLILLSELAQGHGRALYLATDNYLVSQVRAKTKADLGVDTVDDPEGYPALTQRQRKRASRSAVQLGSAKSGSRPSPYLRDTAT